MMGPAFYVMAILGCGEGDAPCQQVSVAPARYESLSACTAATDAAVMRNIDLAFPVVTAQCRRADSAVAVIGREVERPDPQARQPRIQRADYQLPKRARS